MKEIGQPQYGEGVIYQGSDGRVVTQTIKRTSWTERLKIPRRDRHDALKVLAHGSEEYQVLEEMPLKLVGTSEIASWLGIKHPETVHKWRSRYVDFPAPLAHLQIGYVWNWADIRRWAILHDKLTPIEDFDIAERLEPFAFLRESSQEIFALLNTGGLEDLRELARNTERIWNEMKRIDNIESGDK